MHMYTHGGREGERETLEWWCVHIRTHYGLLSLGELAVLKGVNLMQIYHAWW